MINLSIRIAFAVNNSNQLESRHFGEAEKFIFYNWQHDDLVYLREAPNPLKNFDEDQPHGDLKKGRGIIDLLKNLNVDVVVSKQFGKNIKLINQHFIPVITREDHPAEVLPFLKENVEWLKNELQKGQSQYDLLI